jgi:hypothetical protein
MNDFDKQLDSSLNNLKSKTDLLSNLSRSITEIVEAEAQIRTMKDNLEVLIDEMMAKLSLEVRKRMPKLNVSISSGRCDIRYKAKSIVIKPNLNKMSWSIDPNDMGREFLRSFKDEFKISNSFSAIADAIIDYFSGRYKTLNKIQDVR